ncbi:hypothetical protein INR49_028211, partial [Caranx melampygus]
MQPNTVPRLSLINPPQDGRMDYLWISPVSHLGTVPHRLSSHSTLANHSARSAAV